MHDDLPLLEAVLADSHLIVPDQVPGLAQEHARRLGAHRAVIPLVDLDQRVLVPLVVPMADESTGLAVDGTTAGRCFRVLEVIASCDDPGVSTVWIPIVDGTERLGVLQLDFNGPVADEDAMKAFSGLVAELVMTKRSYGDYFERARRREPLSVTSELLWQLLPPLTFGTEDLVIAAAFTPTAHLGGDAFDYGVSATTAHIAVFDAIGHDLQAGLLATTAMAAFRNARRASMTLEGIAAHIGGAIDDNFDVSQFVTGVVAALDIATGRFSWSIAGHPAPLLVRGGRVIKELDEGRGMPFGVGPASAVLVEQLEPGDRVLLYTDGVVESRDHRGEFLALEHLVHLISRAAPSVSPPETMRLLMHAIEDHNHGPFRDDATVVLVEWKGIGSEQLKV